MKAYQVTTETQEFIVLAYNLAEVTTAYEDCDDVTSIRLLGEVVPLRQPAKEDDPKRYAKPADCKEPAPPCRSQDTLQDRYTPCDCEDHKRRVIREHVLEQPTRSAESWAAYLAAADRPDKDLGSRCGCDGPSLGWDTLQRMRRSILGVAQ